MVCQGAKEGGNVDEAREVTKREGREGSDLYLVRGWVAMLCKWKEGKEEEIKGLQDDSQPRLATMKTLGNKVNS